MSDVITELANEANDKAAEIARLKAENSELQNDADLLRAMLSQERLEKQCYMAENAKLRELVRDMAECMDDSQPRCKKCKFRELNCQWFKFDDRMRELGVEVDA